MARILTKEVELEMTDQTEPYRTPAKAIDVFLPMIPKEPPLSAASMLAAISALSAPSIFASGPSEYSRSKMITKAEREKRNIRKNIAKQSKKRNRRK